jgi:SAM-dependent methyltransferase
MVDRYGFDPSWDDEQRRLALLEHCLDQVTTTILTSLGVGVGSKCLEVGAGNGSIARWLRDQVTPSGQVVALDLDIRYFKDDPGIDARECDILVDEIEHDNFDLVHCRALLHHLPGSEVNALRRLASALRPGGVLVAEEPWFGAMFASPTPALATMWKALDDAMPADYMWAVGLAQALHDAGLTEIEMSGDAHLIRGGSPEAQLFQLTIAAVRDRIPAGIDLDTGLSLLNDSDVFEPSTVWYSAWGKREPA